MYSYDSDIEQLQQFNYCITIVQLLYVQYIYIMYICAALANPYEKIPKDIAYSNLCQILIRINFLQELVRNKNSHREIPILQDIV